MKFLEWNGKSKIYVGSGLENAWAEILEKQADVFVVIFDEHTHPLWASSLVNLLKGKKKEVLEIVFSAGEEHKTYETISLIYEKMLEKNIDRKAMLVAVGGGIVCDMAGFVASTYKRGMASCYYATTLMAQIDASHGGKTGYNTLYGKNMIGTFYPPSFVFCDQKTLSSLSDQEWRNGLFEALKHALIQGKELWEKWMSLEKREDLNEDLLFETIKVKYDIVEKDPYEKGLRKILNLGHTIAHAIEKATSYRYSHGEAVALGLWVELFLSHHLFSFPDEVLVSYASFLKKWKFDIKKPCSFEALLSFLKYDKKNEGAKIHFVFLKERGDIFYEEEKEQRKYSFEVDISLLEYLWNEVCFCE